jgi:hypothetical protein
MASNFCLLPVFEETMRSQSPAHLISSTRTAKECTAEATLQLRRFVSLQGKAFVENKALLPKNVS